MSNKQEREKRREERIAGRNEGRQPGIGARDCSSSVPERSSCVVVVVVVLIVADSGGDGGGDASNLEGSREVDSLVGASRRRAGARRPDGAGRTDRVRGPAVPGLQSLFRRSPAAGDRRRGRQRRSQDRLPQLHDHRPQSVPAGAAALAAGEQGRGWNYLELFYRNQGQENSGYADDEFLTAVAKGAGVQDIAKWNEDRKSTKLTDEVEKDDRRSPDLGFNGTPSFAIKGPSTNGLELLGTLSSPSEFEEAIDEAS